MKDTLRILYEDDDCLVVDKPSGLPTQAFARHRQIQMARSAASLLAEHYPELKSVGGSDWGAVHRLDTETSGLVVFARNQSAYDFLRGEFSHNRVQKEYIALVSGKIERPGEIDWPIGPDPKTVRKVQVYRNLKEARRGKAQEAVTTYSPIPLTRLDFRDAQVPLPQGERGTYLLIQIKTGRRHQIRVHLAAIGHPVVGDALYGGPPAKRLCLHASRIRFRHPRGDRWVEARSPPSSWPGKT